MGRVGSVRQGRWVQPYPSTSTRYNNKIDFSHENMKPTGSPATSSPHHVVLLSTTTKTGKRQNPETKTKGTPSDQKDHKKPSIKIQKTPSENGTICRFLSSEDAREVSCTPPGIRQVGTPKTINMDNHAQRYYRMVFHTFPQQKINEKLSKNDLKTKSNRFSKLTTKIRLN
jgi:hypothetical protein